jgi:hypothetical protein
MIDRIIVTRKQYFEILKEAILQTEKYIQVYPELTMYKSILNQLIFIQNIVVNENRVPEKEEIDRVTLGSIAVKNFDYEHDEYADILMDCYSKFLRYKSLQ